MEFGLTVPQEGGTDGLDLVRRSTLCFQTRMTEGLDERLRAFLISVGSLKPRSRADRLGAFLKQTHSLLPTRRTSRPVARIEAVRAVAAASKARARLRRDTGADINVWAAAGLGHDEVRVSSLLSWFLSPTGTHSGGAAFAQTFWNAAGGSELGFDLGTLRRTAVEVCPLANNANRVDVVLEGEDFLVFVEVKIHAGLQPDQLSRYMIAAQSMANLTKKAHYAVIYLAPRDTIRPEGPCRWLSWAKLSRGIHGTYRAETSPVAGLALQFADHIDAFH